MMFKSMTIRKKLIYSYVVISMMVLIMSVFIIYSMSSVDRRYSDLIEFSVERMNITNEIQKNFAEIRRLATDTFLTEGWQYKPESAILENQNRLNELYNQNLELFEQYRQSILSDPNIDSSGLEDRIAAVDNAESALNEYYSALVANFFIGGNGSRDRSILGEYIQALEKNINFMTDNVATHVNNETQALTSLSETTLLTSKIIVAAVVGFMAIVGYMIVTSIAKSMNKLEVASKEVLKGKFDVEVRSNNRDEIGTISNIVGDMVDVFSSLLDEINIMSREMEKGKIKTRINSNLYDGGYKEVAEAVNKTVNDLLTDTSEMLEVVNEYANGNFETKVKRFPGEKAQMHESIDTLQMYLKGVVEEIEKLVHGASEGNLSIRADEESYKGSWKELVNGLNTLLEEVAKPIEEAVTILGEVSQGNLNVEVKGQYKGDFARIKTSLNQTVTTISSYIEEISQVLGEVSNKNLNVEITRQYVGNFNAIKMSINDIIETFNNVIGEINGSSIQVAAGAAQISESSMELADGATRQSNSVEILNKSVNQILEQIESNAENANNTSNLALEAKESANMGNNDMKQMLISMEEINQASESISKIIKVIDDIAFQTNLLALNAAVEAARAGEHGKGFAVVAEEVRNLAQRSKDAAAETNMLIETSIEKTSAGSIIANKTAETLNEIVTQVSEISELIADVADASKNQTESAQNINVGISEVSQVTQITTSTSEETAAAAEELSSQTDIFKSLVGQFKLK